ncbi:metallophosphoesterase family protein [Lewinella sp. IMCC34183]|uniref:metallophosphoesterase family protein n=1 Tax=Lewinella sp. IMCC34183 TaxID=2248762 RepID=UPI000E2394B1|nr:metallophosphoesterase family protein [Lewinella sp. IMCC34183]
MIRIGLLSDTHSYLDPAILEHFADCDEVWHGGDVGDPAVLDTLEAFAPVRGVYGNIDDTEIRRRLPENNVFEVGGVKVLMTHIGGYPGRYTTRVRKLIDDNRPDLYICGHSHILKVMPDKGRHLLHMNPGACGRHGFHRMRTVLRFSIEDARVTGLEVIELGLRGAIPPDLRP